MGTNLVMYPERRDAIFNAALKEFSSKGYERASTNIISKEARISKSLMFHYVGSKQKLFNLVYDYFTNLMRKEYYELINYEERDILKRLHQSYLLQIKLLEKYPQILEINKLDKSQPSINKTASNCYETLFDNIDESKFKDELNVEKCKDIIFWINIGFTNKILNEIHDKDLDATNLEDVMIRLEKYFEELRKLFYK